MSSDHPDFQIVCISVDPENDKRKLPTIEALGATQKLVVLSAPGNHSQYLEKELRSSASASAPIRWTAKPTANACADAGFMAADREARVIGKWPVADAAPRTLKRRPDG
jgi:hypothetical protein